ncbi:MAG: sigma-70 family RNA polymerase sigma factor [Planctomycetes bacterium]|nr:sigma-70 family RNA polymerase sigma factor [Planctomycetota bacterium]
MTRLSDERFESLVRDHHAVVYRAAHRLVGDAALAADVAQDVFLRVLEGKVRLEAAANERATLCWFATRLAANTMRSRRRRAHHEENAMRPDPLSTDDPAEASSVHDLHHTVQRLVDNLPRDLQVPLLMRCQDELTFAAIGTALRLPESTVHDRFQQALRRLRTALSGRGFVVATLGLDDLVARTATVAAPVDLQARLLALPASAALGVAALGQRAATTLVVLMAGTAIAAGAWWLRTEHAPRLVETTGVAAAFVPAPGSGGLEAQDPSPARRERPAESARAPVPTNDGVRAANVAVERSTFRGTVLDAAAWPVAGASVVVVAAGGLKPFVLGDTVTDAAGAFVVGVDPSELSPRRVRVRVSEGTQLLVETDELPLPRAADAEPLALVVPDSLGTATTRWELAVTVRDEHGAALAGVPVSLVPGKDAVPRVDWVRPETGGATGLDGRVALGGRTLGAKFLFVDGRKLGRRSVLEPITIGRAGGVRREVCLASGRELAVRVAAVDDADLGWVDVWAEDEAIGIRHTAEPGRDGVLSVRGLGDGTYRLHVAGTTEWSPFERRGVRATGGPATVRLKRRDDVRDVGDHMAELHGRLVDARSGELVQYSAFQVDVLPLRTGESTLASDRIVPRGAVQQLEAAGQWARFDEVGLAAGSYGVIVKVPGYAGMVGEFALRENEVLADVRMVLERGVEVRGRVVGADGSPARRAHVFLVGEGALADECLAKWRGVTDAARDRTADPSHLVWSAWTGEDGAFVLRDVPASTALRIVARRDDGFAVASVATPAAGNVAEPPALRLAPR